MSIVRGVKCLLCVVNAFAKCVWIKPMKDKRTKTVFKGFTGTLNQSKC